MLHEVFPYSKYQRWFSALFPGSVMNVAFGFTMISILKDHNIFTVEKIFYSDGNSLCIFKRMSKAYNDNSHPIISIFFFGGKICLNPLTLGGYWADKLYVQSCHNVSGLSHKICDCVFWYIRKVCKNSVIMKKHFPSLVM